MISTMLQESLTCVILGKLLHVSGLSCPVDLIRKSFTGSSQLQADPGNPYCQVAFQKL